MGKPACILIGILVCCVTLTGVILGAPVAYLLDRPALKINDPAHSVLLDVTFADSRMVAVGERGIIIYSDDYGVTWRQADVPTSYTLTGVYFPTPQQGWAVGHGGIILHTKDAGETWIRQLDGVTTAYMALETAQTYAKRLGPENAGARRFLRNAKYMVEDLKTAGQETEIPDKPFLDLYFESNKKGFVIGSYGLLFRTIDGGNSWQCWMDHVEDPMDFHLYSIRVVGNIYYITGERGIFFISRDGGNFFQRVETPYSGTYFDMEVAPSGEIVLVGLRGHAYWSEDQGATFKKTDVPYEISFSATTQLENGTMLFANQAGMLMESRDQGINILPIDAPRLAPISSILPFGKDKLMTVGYGGAIPINLPSSGSNDMGGQ